MTDQRHGLDADTLAALDAARVLAGAGVPLFLATPNPDSELGYTLPKGWQHSTADPAVVDRWRPGLALAAVMGVREPGPDGQVRGLDLVDIDPRNGGDPAALNGSMPRIYAAATTPSGGLHSFVAPLGVGSRDNTYQGIDVKGGAPDGTGRGYAFLAPTVRRSKTTGEPAGYRWITAPDPAALAGRDDDASGAGLAARIRELRANSNALRRIAGPQWWQDLLTNTEAQSAQAADKAITEKLREVGEWDAGGPDNFRTVLLRAALTLGGYVGGGWLDEDEARERLEAAVCQVWPAPDTNDLLWIQQGLDDGAVMPFHVYTAADAAAYSDNAQTAAAQGEGEDTPPGEDTRPEVPGPPTWNVWTGLGAGDPFDPAGDGSDQGLAKAVAFRSFGVLRYAGDAGLWIKREAEVWTEHGDDLSGWIVSALAELMPLGQTPIPKDLSERTEAHWQAHRRALFTSSAGAGRIARKLREIVRSDHPSSLKLIDLDSNPNVLWAGGIPWDLRACADRPTVADWIDPATPHLRSAMCAPDIDCPTPRWDAFTEVVLPDPDLRAWALRVLSIALTGFADAALPVLYGRERSGKALDVDTPVLTTAGWSTMGGLHPGDEVYGADGHPTRVTSTSPVMHDHQCYRVRTTDGREVIADAEHLWTVKVAGDYPLREKTLTTAEMLDAGVVKRWQHGRPSYRFRLPTQPVIESPDVDLPIEPYLLGAWLGDGTSTGATLSLGDQDVEELCANLEARGTKTERRWDRTAWTVRVSTGGACRDGFEARARRLGLWGKGRKRVPAAYLTAGTGQRLELLRGLLDTDGYIDAAHGRVELTSVHEGLAHDVLYLVRSLGWKATIVEGVATLDGREIGPKWRVCFTPKRDEACPFALSRRAARITARHTERSQAGVVSIASIEPVESRPVRCIKVARDDGLYLAGPDLIPTHNTSLIEMLVEVLGSYAHAASAKLLAPQDNGHEVIVYDLKGRRLAFIDEGPRRGHDATERLKQLTGGGSLTARPMRANPITFRPTHTLVMTTNNPPAMTDPALRARLRLIPCDAPEDLVRPVRLALLGQSLRAEAPGILARMMGEAARYLADRDSAGHAAAPGFVRELGAEMAAEQDPVRDWQETATVPSQPGTRAHQLYTQFAAWHQENPLYRRLTVPTEAAWGRSLTELGFPAEKTREGKFRPLSVLGGPGTGPLPTPGPAQFVRNANDDRTEQPTTTTPAMDHDQTHSDSGFATTVHGTVHTSCTVEPEPYTPDNRRSDPVFEGVVYGVNGLTPQYDTENTDTESVENTALKGTKPFTVHTPLQEPPLTSGNEAVHTSSASVHGPGNRTEPQTSIRTSGNGRGSGPSVSPRNVSSTAAAEKAAQDKITKAAARKALAEQKRAAAVAEASGPHHDLPAVADRAGRVTAIDVELAGSVLARVNAAGALTVDVETSGYPVGHTHYRLRSVQLGNDGGAVVLDPHDDAQRRVIAEALAGARMLHAHSATADLVPLAEAGLIDAEAAWAKMFDTVIAAKLADPASTGSDPGLKQLAGVMLGADAVAPAADEARATVFKAGKWLTNVDPATTPPERSGWAQIDTGCEVMLRYAASDVLDTAALAGRLPNPPAPVLARERLAQRMTARVAHRGIRLDPEQIGLLSLRHRMARENGRREIGARWSIDNPGSTAQIGEALIALGANLPRTTTGKPSVTAAVLGRLKAQEGTAAAELAAAVLDYRHHDTVLGLFLDPYSELVEHGDGRARPTVYTLGTDTGRMSCVRPNLQQLPREGGVRACMTADDGFVLASADFSSVELRVAAALSNDAALAHLIAEEDAGRGDGLHWQIARQVWGPNATKAHRYKAKRCVPLDTTILTRRGWLRHDEVRVGDETPGRDTDGAIRWTRVTAVHHYDDAELVRMHGGQSWSAVTTPDHRWSASRRVASGARRWTVEEMVTTERVTTEHTLHLGGVLDDQGTLDVTSDEAALIAWSITDGSVEAVPVTGITAQGRGGRRRKIRVSLYQSKIAGVTAIEALLARLDMPHIRYSSPVAHKRTMPGHTWTLCAEAARELYGRARLLDDDGFAREQLSAFVLGLSTKAREAFLDAAIEAEGSRDVRGVATIAQNEGPTAEALALAAHLCGFYVSRTVNDRRGNAVNLKLRLRKPRVTGQRLVRSDAGRAPVWCVTTEFGTWTMRQDDKIMLTGNCVFGRIYGAGIPGVAKAVGIDEATAAQVVATLDAITPTLAQWSRQLGNAVRRGLREYPTYSGRVIHLDPATPHKAPNYAIQGTARELLVDALIAWADTRWGDATLFPVHDELVVQVPAADADAATAALLDAMTSTLNGVAIKAEADPALHYWQDSA